MLRKFLDFQLSLTEEGKPLARLRPLIMGLDTFLYEAPCTTHKGPHIRDAIDLKRWMSIVIVALLPCILIAIWNTGVQDYVYSSGNFQLMEQYLKACSSFSAYRDFVMQEDRFWTILQLGASAFLPVMLISYTVGGICEGIFACVRGHEIAEGFLVTGMLYPLILPPTIPYWMVAVGVALGVILSKELFGGTGMNIMNPALTCRAFLFFAYPGNMSGSVWVGTNPTTIRESLLKMNAESGRPLIDAYSQATPLSYLNIGDAVKRIHVDAIAANRLNVEVPLLPQVNDHLAQWNASQGSSLSLAQLDPEQMRQFVTAPLAQGGLELAPETYEAAYHFSSLNYGASQLSDFNFFIGNQLGCMGETSTLACLLGALILIVTKVGSWRTMLATVLGAVGTAFAFQVGATFFGAENGAWNSAIYALDCYRHLLLGGLAFGIVFMATDPVSSPAMPSAKWIYGLLIGSMTVIIRLINPAYPEGVMLAILMGNVVAPLVDRYAALNFRRSRLVVS